MSATADHIPCPGGFTLAAGTPFPWATALSPAVALSLPAIRHKGKGSAWSGRYRGGMARPV